MSDAPIYLLGWDKTSSGNLQDVLLGNELDLAFNLYARQ